MTFWENKMIRYLSFEETKEYARKLGLKTSRE